MTIITGALEMFGFYVISYWWIGGLIDKYSHNMLCHKTDHPLLKIENSTIIINNLNNRKRLSQ